MATDKWFIPLENNPEVMSSLTHKLGLSNTVAFHDVFSIDDPELLSFIPRPAHALLLTFPGNETQRKFLAHEDAGKEQYQGSGPDEPVVWYKQTIRNACGLMGVLHGVSNGSARKLIEPNSDLDQLLKDAIPLKPTERADLLFQSKSLEAAHKAAAEAGDTVAPPAQEEVEHHYVCFIKSDDNEIWELDGARKGPLNRGKVGPDDDLLSESALDKTIRSFLKREAAFGGGDLRFSLIALAPSLD